MPVISVLSVPSLSRPFLLLRRYWPFTLSGSIALGLSFYLLGHAYAASNIYSFILGSLLFIVVAILLFFSIFFSMRLASISFLWESHPQPVAGSRGSEQSIRIEGENAPYFFRFHFMAKALLEAGRECYFRIYRETSCSSAGRVSLPFYFPVGGNMKVEGGLFLKDILGFTRRPIGGRQRRDISVRSPLLSLRLPSRFHNAAYKEGERRKQPTEEEKYHMREYIPGDRSKDINWKVSIRLNELITRIAYRSQEEDRLYHLEFRNFTFANRDDPVSIMHLSYLKSWLLSFLLLMLRENPNSQFRVVSAKESFTVSDEDTFERFIPLLSSLSWSRGRHCQDRDPPGLKEKFLFSTPFDPSYNSGYTEGSGGAAATYIFRTAMGRGREAEKLLFLDLDQPFAWPGTWLLRRPPAAAMATPSARKRGASTPTPQGSGFLEERKIRVSLFL